MVEIKTSAVTSFAATTLLSIVTSRLRVDSHTSDNMGKLLLARDVQPDTWIDETETSKRSEIGMRYSGHLKYCSSLPSRRFCG